MQIPEGWHGSYWQPFECVSRVSNRGNADTRPTKALLCFERVVKRKTSTRASKPPNFERPRLTRCEYTAANLMGSVCKRLPEEPRVG